jgi:hypothetical protein
MSNASPSTFPMLPSADPATLTSRFGLKISKVPISEIGRPLAAKSVVAVSCRFVSLA